MPSILKGRLAGSAVLVLVVVCLVHAAPGAALERMAAAENDEKPSKVAGGRKLHKPGENPGPLPAPVEEMRQAILAAAHSGNIDDLRVPLDWNELKPEVAAAASEDPIAYWKKTSGDGNGREILAVLAEILSMNAAELPFGKDLENNIIYVWPYLAEVRARQADAVARGRPHSPRGRAEAKRMQAKKKWTWWRLTIGADGTWHSFKKAE